MISFVANMPTVELSETLVAFLLDRAKRGHDGDINDFLHSYFRVTADPKKNDDRKILGFISSHVYAAQCAPTKKYMALLAFFVRQDPIRFCKLEGFTVPGTKRILVSSDNALIQRRFAGARVQKIKGSDLFALLPTARADAKDYAEHIMSRLGYPVGPRQEVKRTLIAPYDLSLLDI